MSSSSFITPDSKRYKHTIVRYPVCRMQLGLREKYKSKIYSVTTKFLGGSNPSSSPLPFFPLPFPSLLLHFLFLSLEVGPLNTANGLGRAVSSLSGVYAFIGFYRAMHFSAFARSWDRMSSVCPSVCPSVCNVGDL